MFSSFRLSLLILVSSFPLFAADKPAQPTAPPPVPAPAFVDIVSFQSKGGGESDKLTVTSCPTMVRFDESNDGYSILFNPKTEQYIGLEHRNYTWWDFSWPEIRDAVSSTKRYTARLNELNLAGLNSENPPNPGGPAPTNSVPDNSGYVWRQTTDKKQISGIDCTRWIGDTVSGEAVEAWCASGLLPKVQSAFESLRVTSDPLALVPIRTLVPSLVLVVNGALNRGGITPVQIIWGSGTEKNSFTLLSVKTTDGKPGLFSVPKLYVKTTLITMDGIIDQKK